MTEDLRRVGLGVGVDGTGVGVAVGGTGVGVKVGGMSVGVGVGANICWMFNGFPLISTRVSVTVAVGSSKAALTMR